MRLLIAILPALLLAGCGMAYPPPAGASQEVVALMLIARELNDISVTFLVFLFFWLAFK